MKGKKKVEKVDKERFVDGLTAPIRAGERIINRIFGGK